MCFVELLARMYIDDAEVVRYGTAMICYIGAFYTVFCIVENTSV